MKIQIKNNTSNLESLILEELKSFQDEQEILLNEIKLRGLLGNPRKFARAYNYLTRGGKAARDFLSTYPEIRSELQTIVNNAKKADPNYEGSVEDVLEKTRQYLMRSGLGDGLINGFKSGLDAIGNFDKLKNNIVQTIDSSAGVDEIVDSIDTLSKNMFKDIDAYTRSFGLQYEKIRQLRNKIASNPVRGADRKPIIKPRGASYKAVDINGQPIRIGGSDVIMDPEVYKALELFSRMGADTASGLIQFKKLYPTGLATERERSNFISFIYQVGGIKAPVDKAMRKEYIKKLKEIKEKFVKKTDGGQPAPRPDADDAAPAPRPDADDAAPAPRPDAAAVTGRGWREWSKLRKFGTINVLITFSYIAAEFGDTSSAISRWLQKNVQSMTQWAVTVVFRVIGAFGGITTQEAKELGQLWGKRVSRWVLGNWGAILGARAAALYRGEPLLAGDLHNKARSGSFPVWKKGETVDQIRERYKEFYGAVVTAEASELHQKGFSSADQNIARQLNETISIIKTLFSATDATMLRNYEDLWIAAMQGAAQGAEEAGLGVDVEELLKVYKKLINQYGGELIKDKEIEDILEYILKKSKDTPKTQKALNTVVENVIAKKNLFMYNRVKKINPSLFPKREFNKKDFLVPHYERFQADDEDKEKDEQGNVIVYRDFSATQKNLLSIINSVLAPLEINRTSYGNFGLPTDFPSYEGVEPKPYWITNKDVNGSKPEPNAETLLRLNPGEYKYIGENAFGGVSGKDAKRILKFTYGTIKRFSNFFERPPQKETDDQEIDRQASNRKYKAQFRKFEMAFFRETIKEAGEDVFKRFLKDQNKSLNRVLESVANVYINEFMKASRNPPKRTGDYVIPSPLDE